MTLLKRYKFEVAYFERENGVALGHGEGSGASVYLVEDSMQDTRRVSEHSREGTSLLIG